jgi:hypothetical protein
MLTPDMAGDPSSIHDSTLQLLSVFVVVRIVRMSVVVVVFRTRVLCTVCVARWMP